MKKPISKFLALLFVLQQLADNIANGQIPEPLRNYSVKNILIKPNIFVAYWDLNQTDIIFEVHVQTPGWLAFGLSADGKMKNADIVTAWANDDGTGHFANMYIDSNKVIRQSKLKTWRPMYMAKNNNYTVFQFTRKLTVCEENSEEIHLNFTRKNNIIYAFGSLNGDQLVYHNRNRGSDEIELKRINQNRTEECSNNKADSKFTSAPADYFANYVELVPYKFRLYWNVTDTLFIAEVHVKTNGWVGFGFSPNGGMANSDVFVGWISNGTANFTDRYAYSNERVLVDLNNNLELISYSEKGAYTVFRYSRKIVLCDPDDRTIDQGTPYVIYAWSNQDPQPGADITYHGATYRGSQQINVFGNLSVSKSNDVDFSKLDVVEFPLTNVILPNSSTFYYCKAFPIPPNLLEKKHILRWEIVMPTINEINIHHFVLYECVSSYNGTPAIKSDCLDRTNPKNRYCGFPTLFWAVGASKVFTFPEGTGYPIGNQNDYSYVVVEVHYNNPTQEIGYFDSLTIKYYITPELRPNELGSLALGTYPQPMGILIPPKSNNFIINSYCYNDCFKDTLEERNLTVVIAAPHTHLVGKQIYTKIIRNGVDIGYLERNMYYNFEFQNQFILNPPINITKNDVVVTTCVYSSVDRNYTTKGGFATDEEMCIQYLIYYPRSPNFKTCFSVPDVQNQFQTFAQLKSQGLIDFNMPTSSNSSDFLASLNSAYSSLLSIHASNFSSQITDSLVSMYANSNYSSACQGSKNRTSYPPAKPTNIFQDLSQCELLFKPQSQNQTSN